MSRDLRTTDKQWEVMRAILAAADAGKFLGYVELNDLVSFGRASGATAAQIRGTIKHQVLQMKRRGYLTIEYDTKLGRKSIIKPTPAAYSKFRVT